MKKEEITLSDIEYLAGLSALEFSDSEKKVLVGEVSSVINMLNGCANADVKCKEGAKTMNFNDLRDDTVLDSLNRDTLLGGAPRCDCGFVVVPKVVD